MRPLTFLIKPASGLCNLCCDYCFYHDVSENRQTPSYGMMTDETLECLVAKAFSHAEGQVSFAFQGGEPTLAGLAFFQRLVELQSRYNTRGIRVYNSLQTNGTLLDEAWARFFKEHHFLVGVSLDGPPQLHNRFRRDADGGETFGRVMDGIEQLRRFGCDHNILCVVNGEVAAGGRRVYRFFKSNGMRHLQFIPCLNPLGGEAAHPYSLSAKDYLAFLKATFDLWYADLFTKTPVSIRNFENYAGMIAGYPPENCGMSGVCSCYLLVEADGSVYPCDFYALDEYRLGNIKTDNLEAMLDGDVAGRFRAESVPLPERCRACKWLSLCRNGCKRDRSPQSGLNLYCEAFSGFFDYAYPRLKKAAAAKIL